MYEYSVACINEKSVTELNDLHHINYGNDVIQIWNNIISHPDPYCNHAAMLKLKKKASRLFYINI